MHRSVGNSYQIHGIIICVAYMFTKSAIPNLHKTQTLAKRLPSDGVRRGKLTTGPLCKILVTQLLHNQITLHKSIKLHSNLVQFILSHPISPKCVLM